MIDTHSLGCLILGMSLLGMVNSHFECISAGKFPHDESPSMYYECHLVGDNKFSMFEQSCPQDSCFSPFTHTCAVVNCKDDADEQSMSTKPITTFTCSGPGKFPHVDPLRKEAFYKCTEIDGKFLMYEYRCLPSKPCFSYSRQSCLLC